MLLFLVAVLTNMLGMTLAAELLIRTVTTTDVTIMTLLVLFARHFQQLLRLELIPIELQRPAVFADGTYCRFIETFWSAGVNLQRDIDCTPG